jgi:hypothetical protein
MGVILASLMAARARQETRTIGDLGRIMLLALLPFVAFNIVLSPQYMIWLVSLAAVACFSPRRRVALMVLTATFLTPVWYPSPEFPNGFNLFQTAVLLGRNLLLILAWASLIRESFRPGETARPWRRPGLQQPVSVPLDLAGV